MTRNTTRREIEREIEQLRDDGRDVPEVRSEVTTVTSPEDAVDVPDGATVVHESTAILAYVEDGS